MYRVYEAAERVHVRSRGQDFVEGILWGCGSAVRVMTLLYKVCGSWTYQCNQATAERRVASYYHTTEIPSLSRSHRGV